MKRHLVDEDRKKKGTNFQRQAEHSIAQQFSLQSNVQNARLHPLSDEKHPPSACRYSLMAERIEVVKNKRPCFVCLNSGHGVRNC